MKCYYEILGLGRDASDEDIKKCYRKLALQWHPDKNPTNTDEAKTQFQLVQQAYEVLGDSHERAWYDKHRESIVRGGGANNKFEDSCLNVFQFFTSGCYSGFGDDDKGFYSVYREVFNTIAAEESEFYSDTDSDFEIPNFGKSSSSFDDVVHPFYSFWQSYATKKSYSWLNVHDIRQAPNRKVVRLMEKDNKKVRDEAKKDRNEEVRALVKFVKKRDKRVQAHAEYVKEKKDINLRKAEVQRSIKLKERRDEIANHHESEWSKFSNLEKELKDIEDSLTQQFGDISESDNSSDEKDESIMYLSKQDALYCVACNKLFKTPKTFQNHENSKKHKDNTFLLKLNVLSGEDLIEKESLVDSPSESTAAEKTENVMTNVEGLNDSDVSFGCSSDQSALANDESDEVSPAFKKVKQSKSKNILKNSQLLLQACSSIEDSAIGVSEQDLSEVLMLDDLLGSSKKQRKKNRQKQLLIKFSSEETQQIYSFEESNSNQYQKNTIKGKSSKKKQLVSENQDKNSCTATENVCAKTNNLNFEPQELKGEGLNKPATSKSCETCKSSFPSKNKLFEHLKSSGHAVCVSLSSKPVKESSKSKRNKKS